MTVTDAHLITSSINNIFLILVINDVAILLFGLVDNHITKS